MARRIVTMAPGGNFLVSTTIRFSSRPQTHRVSLIPNPCTELPVSQSPRLFERGRRPRHRDQILVAFLTGPERQPGPKNSPVSS